MRNMRNMRYTRAKTQTSMTGGSKRTDNAERVGTMQHMVLQVDMSKVMRHRNPAGHVATGMMIKDEMGTSKQAK